jgi:hypothetical protein
MSVDILLGLQWGDEGKGKIVDFLAKLTDLIELPFFLFSSGTLFKRHCFCKNFLV